MKNTDRQEKDRVSGMQDDLVHRYVRFHFAEYEIDPYGWTTKNPYSVAEFAEVHGLGKVCDHCGEIQRWVDMFDIAWCRTMYWGEDRLLLPGWEPCNNGELCTVVIGLDEEVRCAKPALAFSPVLGLPCCRSCYRLFAKSEGE